MNNNIREYHRYWDGLRLTWLSPCVALSIVGIEAATVLYHQLTEGEMPSTILVGVTELAHAYECLHGSTLAKLNVVCVPGMPYCAWAVLGPSGMVWSRP